MRACDDYRIKNFKHEILRITNMTSSAPQKATTAAPQKATTACIIGGGIAGLCAAIELHEELNEHNVLHDITIIERESVLGGTALKTPGRIGYGFHYVGHKDSALQYLRDSLAFRKYINDMADKEGVDTSALWPTAGSYPECPNPSYYVFPINCKFNQKEIMGTVREINNEYKNQTGDTNPAGVWLDSREKQEFIKNHWNNEPVMVLKTRESLVNPAELIKVLKQVAHKKGTKVQTSTSVKNVQEDNQGVIITTVNAQEPGQEPEQQQKFNYAVTAAWYNNKYLCENTSPPTDIHIRVKAILRLRVKFKDGIVPANIFQWDTSDGQGLMRSIIKCNEEDGSYEVLVTSTHYTNVTTQSGTTNEPPEWLQKGQATADVNNIPESEKQHATEGILRRFMEECGNSVKERPDVISTNFGVVMHETYDKQMNLNGESSHDIRNDSSTWRKIGKHIWRIRAQKMSTAMKPAIELAKSMASRIIASREKKIPRENNDQPHLSALNVAPPSCSPPQKLTITNTALQKERIFSLLNNNECTGYVSKFFRRPIKKPKQEEEKNRIDKNRPGAHT